MATAVETDLHKKPRLAPVFLVLCLVAALATFLTGARTLPAVMRALSRLEGHEEQLLQVGYGIVALVSILAVYDHFRRRRLPVVPAYLRINRAFAYGLGLAVAIELYRTSGDPLHLQLLVSDTEPQLIFGGTAFLLSFAAYALVMHPLVKEKPETFAPYQILVQQQRDSYDFVVGVARKDDYKRAETGPRDWLVMPETSLWTNLLVLGGIGSGKTSALAYPFVLQAIGKYPNNEGLRPSIVLLDLKGDNALKLWDFAKRLGRRDEFWVVRPGNELVDKDGKDLIPRDRFLQWNPVGGDDAADLRALQLLDGLEATNKTPSHQYWYDVESEFLAATLQLLDLVKGHGTATLYDLYMFGLNTEERNRLVDSVEAQGSIAQLYFKQRFLKLDPEQQSHLISGLAAKLSRLATETLQSTFCPAHGQSRQVFPGFLPLVVDKPGILVFSVPEATYSQELARLLGVSFLRAFQTQMLRRTDPQFGAAGGNTERLVLQVTDECWAYMNRGIASFTAVSRQAKVCNLYLCQSLDQLHDSYRDTILGNFRTKAVLGVNDELTLKSFATLFGEVKEQYTTSSTSENLQDVRHGAFTQTMKGKSQGVSKSTNTSERIVPRFSQTEIQHLAPGRMIVHMFDGERQHEATAVETTPYYRLPYHLLHPLAHPAIRCDNDKTIEHEYTAAADGGLVCSRCKRHLPPDERKELDAYKAILVAA